MGAASSHEPDTAAEPTQVAEPALTEETAKVVIQASMSKIAKKRAARAAAEAERAAMMGPKTESAAAKRKAGWAAKPTNSLGYYGNYGKAEAEAAKAAKAAAKKIDKAAEQRLLCVCGFIAESPEALRGHFAKSGVLRHFHDTRADEKREPISLPMECGSVSSSASSSELAKGRMLQENRTLACVCGFVASSPQVFECHIARSGILSHIPDYRARLVEC